MTRLVLLLIALMFFAPAAQAASFDCAKAATSFETAICGNPDLSRQDEILAQAYTTALGGLSKPAADEVKAAQHDWLGYVERVCTDEAEPLTGAYNDDQTQCLISTFKSRVKALEASRMQGGYRFYPIDRYLVEKDTEAEPDAYHKVADKAFSTVRIDRDDSFAKAFNAMIETDRVGYTDLFAKGAKTITAGDVTDDYDISVGVKSVTDYRITLTSDIYWYGHGAAHGNYSSSYRHFLVADKRLLEASDIFAGDDWQKTLGKLVLDKLQATIDGGVWPESVKDIPEWAADPSRWDFSQEGLIVQFQPYEVTAYAAGSPTVTIPWDDLSGVLAEHALEIATY